jgi:DNA-binding CsgD family transcriptional regulator
MLASVRREAGEPDARGLAEEAYVLATSSAADDDGSAPRELAHVLAWTRDRLDLIPSLVLADVLIASRRFEQARAVLGDLVELGDELLAARAIWLLSIVELDAGRWDLAAELAERACDIVSLYQTGDSYEPYLVLAELALHRGDVDVARELAARTRRFPAAHSSPWGGEVDAFLGLASRAEGDLRAAVDHFAAADATAHTAGRVDPSDLWWRADYVETLLELGRVDRAVELLDVTEPVARRLGRDHVLAQLKRCRGLVAAARGDLQVALAILEQAVEQVDVETDPFDHARALLALGVTRRRARQKRGAREAIAAALAGFEALGEVPWTKRAQAELGRIGGRTREEGLTPAERRVAALVADGRTNREVAAALSLGERTVETHLTHIYAKLGVRTRTELARVYEPAS